jgi:hypothetical protein
LLRKAAAITLLGAIDVRPAYVFSSAFEPSCGRGRQLDRHEQIGGVDVVLTGLIDDANVALAAGVAIGQHLIDLSGLEVLHADILHADRERTARPLNSHDLSPENA